MPQHNVTNGTVTDITIWTRYHVSLTAWFSIIVFLSIFGLFSNLTLFVTIVSSKKLRSGSGALIAHSIFWDGLMCFPVIPLVAATLWAAQYHLPPESVCRWFMLLFYFIVWTSTWAPVPIAANRFVAIFFPHFYGKSVSRTTLPYIILFSCTISVSCSLVLFFGVGAKFESTRPWGTCGSTITKPTDFAIIMAMCTTLPTVLQGAAYIPLFAVSYTRNWFQRRKVSAVPAILGVDKVRLPLQGIQARRFRTTQMVFAAYVWSTICYMLSPILLSAAPVLYRTEPFIALFIRAVLLLGYATSPVSI